MCEVKDRCGFPCILMPHLSSAGFRSCLSPNESERETYCLVPQHRNPCAPEIVPNTKSICAAAILLQDFSCTHFSPICASVQNKDHRFDCNPFPGQQACSLEFPPNSSNLRGNDDGQMQCPRCGSTSLHRHHRQQPPSIFLTPSGLIMTEDVLRQLVVAHFASTNSSAEVNDASGALAGLLSALRQPGMFFMDDQEQLLEAISRSMESGTSVLTRVTYPRNTSRRLQILCQFPPV